MYDLQEEHQSLNLFFRFSSSEHRIIGANWSIAMLTFICMEQPVGKAAVLGYTALVEEYWGWLIVGCTIHNIQCCMLMVFTLQRSSWTPREGRIELESP